MKPLKSRFLRAGHYSQFFGFMAVAAAIQMGSADVLVEPGDLNDVTPQAPAQDLLPRPIVEPSPLVEPAETELTDIEAGGLPVLPLQAPPTVDPRMEFVEEPTTGDVEDLDLTEPDEEGTTEELMEPVDEAPFWRWSQIPGAAQTVSPPGILSADSSIFSGLVSGAPFSYDPLTQALQGFGATATLSATYDSNAAFSYAPGLNNDDSDFFMTLAGTLAYQTQGTDLTYGASYSGSYSEYFDNSSLSGYNQSLGGNVNYNGGAWTASLNARISQNNGANRYYQGTVDEWSYSYSLTASYRYSAKTSFSGNFSQTLNNADSDFSDTSSFSAGLSANYIYSARTQFGAGLRYSQQIGDNRPDRRSIGPTFTTNYRLSEKISLNSQLGLDFSSYQGESSTDPNLSAAISANYRASELWGMNLTLRRGWTASGYLNDQFEERTGVRLGYYRRIQRFTWNVGVSYEYTTFDTPDSVVGPTADSREYFSIDTSIGTTIFADTTNASIFARYSDESGGANPGSLSNRGRDSFQIGASLSRSF